MNQKLKTYQEVLDETESDSKRYLLIGNGFSMAYNKERFSFTSLLENAVEKGLIQENSGIYKIFKKFETKDFEEVIKLLEFSVQVLDEYTGLDIETKKTIFQDAQNLKEHLVKVITNNHPEKITDITNNEYLKCANFINDYNVIYSLNYDLLLYWTTIKIIDFFKNGKLQAKRLLAKNGVIHDGFCDPDENTTLYVTYANDSRDQEIHHLHGALHIFDHKSKVIKNTFLRTNKTLKEQTLENLEKGVYPVFVSEGTSEKKKERIIHNPYLNHSYKSFYKIGAKTKINSLVIFGTTLKNNDNHIKEAILNNNIARIYFGINSEEKKHELEPFVQELLKKDKIIDFYDYKTVKIWR